MPRQNKDMLENDALIAFVPLFDVFSPLGLTVPRSCKLHTRVPERRIFSSKGAHSLRVPKLYSLQNNSLVRAVS